LLVRSSSWLTIGPQLAYSHAAPIGDLSPLKSAGIGAFASYRLMPNLYAHGSFAGYFGCPDVRTPWDGGRTVQMLGGVKVGVTRDRVGLFGKARFGVNTRARVRSHGRQGRSIPDARACCRHRSRRRRRSGGRPSASRTVPGERSDHVLP
jgi:hypothetical protein